MVTSFNFPIPYQKEINAQPVTRNSQPAERGNSEI